jgi:hypothetical protein
MIKVIILCNNFEATKTIINKVVYSISEIKIVGIYNKSNEIPDAINDMNPDLIITTNKNLITLLNKKSILYNSGIILITNENVNTSNYTNVLAINNYLPYETISNTISEFIDETFHLSKKEKITNTLKNLGFDFKLSGTVYLYDAILYASSFKGYYSYEKIYKDVYTYVAKQNGSDVDRVKWSIARTINYMCNKHTKESYKIVEKYFGVCYPEKPTPKTVIGFIANILDL